MNEQEAAKEAVGQAAARLVEDGMRLGLGSGSTAACAIEAIGRRVREEGLHVQGVPTSYAAERRARTCGIPLVTLDDVEALDLALDGADEVDPALDLIKGRGAAMARERVVAAQAARFVVLADPSKQVEAPGTHVPVPVEVLPMAAAPVMRAVEALGGAPELRMAERKDGPVVTDQGLWVIDVRFAGGIADAEALSARLHVLPGVLDHGLFLGMATDVLIGHADGHVEHVKHET